MTFESEYLGGFEFIFENNLGPETGDQAGFFDEKTSGRKISCNYAFIFINFNLPKL
jgi:hypothetical protein